MAAATVAALWLPEIAEMGGCPMSIRPMSVRVRRQECLLEGKRQLLLTTASANMCVQALSDALLFTVVECTLYAIPS